MIFVLLANARGHTSKSDVSRNAASEATLVIPSGHGVFSPKWRVIAF